MGPLMDTRRNPLVMIGQMEKNWQEIKGPG